MIDLGNFFLIGAFLLTVYGLLAGVVGGLRADKRWVDSSIKAVHGSTLLAFASIVFLGAAFLRHDYRYAYVWKTSNNDMSPVYLISAIWGGMDGSMLLWAVLLCGYASAVFLFSSRIPQRLLQWLPVPLHGATGFFLGVTALYTNPFRLSPVVAADGNGLNPLLQNPSMMIHPPTLYLGFTGLVVPFAFAFSVLLSGEVSKLWSQLTRRWTLVAWGFLTAGIILGGNWAYIELGWGGFWAWDPVENASFMPWLSATAFLHSIMVEERRGMLRVWNIVLSILGYLLSVFGTFLTRSGVVQSVHAFAKSDIGTYFLLYIGVVSVIALVLLVRHYSQFRSENHFESLFSREAVFLFNNLILLAICFATFWGVMFPVFSEALTDEKVAVGPPFFNAVNTPLFLALIFLMGVGPLISWKKASTKGFLKIFTKPLVAGFVVTSICLFFDRERYLTAVSFGLCAFVLYTVFAEYHRAVKARKLLGGAGGILQVMRSRPQRYGGLFVHVGVAVMAISITASMGYKTERDIILNPGERYDIGRFSLNLLDIHEEDHGNYAALRSEVQVFERGTDRELTRLHPERRFYKVNQEATTEVDIRITPREDLYLALAGIEGERSAVLKVFINPLQMWLWVGSVIMLAGMGIVLLPRTVQERGALAFDLFQKQPQSGERSIG